MAACAAPAAPAPAEPAAPAATTEVSFANDVMPILESRCIRCHGGERVEGELILKSYAEIMAGGESGPVVVAGDASASSLVELSASGEMPKRGPKLTPAQVQTLTDWVNQGAQDS
jgi:hypothetical protein